MVFSFRTQSLKSHLLRLCSLGVGRTTQISFGDQNALGLDGDQGPVGVPRASMFAPHDGVDDDHRLCGPGGFVNVRWIAADDGPFPEIESDADGCGDGGLDHHHVDDVGDHDPGLGHRFDLSGGLVAGFGCGLGEVCDLLGIPSLIPWPLPFPGPPGMPRSHRAVSSSHCLRLSTVLADLRHGPWPPLRRLLLVVVPPAVCGLSLPHHQHLPWHTIADHDPVASVLPGPSPNDPSNSRGGLSP